MKCPVGMQDAKLMQLVTDIYEACDQQVGYLFN